MNVVAVIPARLGSTRLPAKALLRETGRYLVQHVHEQVTQARLIDRIVVATDDERIVSAVRSFGGDARMTSPEHTSGTDRVAEVAQLLGLGSDDIVLNVQGDEPEIDPAVVDSLVGFMCGGSDKELRRPGATRARIGTVAVPFDDDSPREGSGSPLDPNCVKVVVDAFGCAKYFSRSLIPYPRDTGGVVDRPARWLLHLGVYAFRVDTLLAITASHCQAECKSAESDSATLSPAGFAVTESLEQLRWLMSGHEIGVVVGGHRSMGIDTPEQYAAFVRRDRDKRIAPAMR